MKSFSKSISISLRREDRIYGEMIEAVAAFYQSKGDQDRGNVSRLIMRLLRANVPQMIEEIKRVYGVNPLDIYREFNDSLVSRDAFFDRKINRRDLANEYIESKLEEAYKEEK
jgi:hypothetical protein